MEVGGGGLSWVEVGAPFRNVNITIVIEYVLICLSVHI